MVEGREGKEGGKVERWEDNEEWRQVEVIKEEKKDGEEKVER